MPGSFLELAVAKSGGSAEAQRVAVAADMAWGLASGRILDMRLATGAVTNPRVAALLQAPRSTTVATQTMINKPFVWKAVSKIEPVAGTVDLGPKAWENIILSLAPELDKK
jgi:hypothetical protein